MFLGSGSRHNAKAPASDILAECQAEADPDISLLQKWVWVPTLWHEHSQQLLKSHTWPSLKPSRLNIHAIKELSRRAHRHRKVRAMHLKALVSVRTWLQNSET